MKNLFLACVLLAQAMSSAAAAKSVQHQENYLNSVKLTFLSWMSGSTKISYERAFPSIHQSGEICTSLICAGYDKYDNDPLGFTIRYGHKFFLGKNDIALKGFYLRPEAIFSYYHYNGADGGRKLADMGSLIGSVGYQYVYKRFLADFWFGGGYAFGTPAETNYHHGFELWHWLGKEYKHLAMSFSIRLGICF